MELSTKTSRIEVVDALRGFAGMAILLVHNLEHFIFPVYPESSPEWLTILDNGVLYVIFSLKNVHLIHPHQFVHNFRNDDLYEYS